MSIVNASRTAPLSIIIVGVGDGPWDQARHLDSHLKNYGQAFDNVRFIEYAEAIKGGDRHFAELALCELPKQYRKMCEFGLFRQQEPEEPPRRRQSARAAARYY